MKVSADGRKRVEGLEGCRLKAYLCPAKVWTIGYGHTGPDVYEGLEITHEQADELLELDLKRFERCVDRKCPKATQEQFDAMVSLALNIGEDAFANHSSVARLHNLERYSQAAQAFAMWNEIHGKVSPILVRRRAQEAALYIEGIPAEELEHEDMPQAVSGENHLSKSRTLNAQVATGGSIAAGAVADQVQKGNINIAGWQDQAQQLLPYFDQMKWVLLALALAGVVYGIYARVSDRHEGAN